MDHRQGLADLRAGLSAAHPERLEEFLTLDWRLRENLDQEARYGPDESKRAARAQIVEGLNRLALDTVGVSFNELCERDTPASSDALRVGRVPRRPGQGSGARVSEGSHAEGGVHTASLRVYEVVEKPPLYVNVPAMPNQFVGREELVGALVARLKAGEHPALSADGLAGVGKTTLAIALAHHREVLEHFADGVLWAGLGPHPDSMSALAGWGEALGLDVAGLTDESQRAQAVKNAIGQRRLLLVIDDAWQLEAALRLRCGGRAAATC